MTDFITTATRLVERGYSVIPIMPGEKRPGEFKGNQWIGMNQWQRFCDKSPTKFQLDIWAKWPEPSICLALGRASNVTAIDFDYGSPEVRAALEACLPPSPVKKMGAKGYTAMYRGFAVVSKKYLLDGVSVIEVLAHGKQTVLPPSIHPEGMSYHWLTPDTLESLTASELPELPHDIHDRIAKALEPFQSKVEKQAVNGKAIQASVQGDNDSFWRDINDTALLNLDNWVPRLIPDAKRGANRGYRAVAHWRDGDGANIGITPDGIRDFARDAGMTAIDLVIAVTGATLDGATAWLQDALGMRQEAVFDAKVFEPPPAKVAPVAPWKKAEPVAAPCKRKAGSLEPRGAVGKLTQYINETSIRPQPILALAAALCAIGTLAGRKYRSPSNLRTNLFAISLADSGAGKNHSRQIIDRLFSDFLGAEKKIGGSKIASGSGLLSALHRSPSILFQIDEFGMFLGAMLDKRGPKHLIEIMSHMTELFTSSNLTYHGIEYADQRDRPRQEIVQPCLSVYGTTVPGHFWKALESSNAVDGSLARFLIFESEENYPDDQNAPEKEPPAELVDLLARINEGIGGIASALDGSHTPELMHVSYDDAATKMLKEMKLDTTKKLRALEGTPFTSFWARRDELTIKVAMIHAIGCDPENPTINTYDVEFARAIVDRSINQLVDGVERYVSDNAAENFSKRVIEIVRKAGGSIDKSALYKRTLFLGRDRDTTLKALLGSEDLVEVIKETGGRPKTTYRLKDAAPF
tara:strand:+ start:1489 stop:3738 length:2250 start_codon:yes stop_codon:yes gene_type:complete